MNDDSDIQQAGIETADILQAILDNITNSVVVMDKGHRVICFNNLAKDTLRSIHHKDLKVGDDYRGFVKEYNMEAYLEAFDKAVSGVTVSLEKEIIIQEQKKWFYMKFSPVYGKAGELLGVTFTNSDIDWGKKKERALARSNEQLAAKTKELEVSEKYFRTLIETSSDAIVLLDETGKVVYQTRSTEKITGYTLEEIQRIDGITLIHPDDRESDSSKFMEFVKNPGSSMSLKHRFKKKTGDYIWIEGTYRNLLSDENVKAIVLNYNDVTERVTATHNLNERIKEISTIYEVNNILQDEQQSVDDVFRKIVSILPSGWQHTEVCEAKIEFNGREYTTNKYQASEFSQKAGLITQDGRSGCIEVVYTKECPPDFEGPFLKEERHLIDALADIIQVYFNKRSSQEALRHSEALFRGAFEFSAIGMALVGLDNKWLVVNKEICNILGYTEAEMLTLATHEITVPEDQELESPLLKKIIDGEIDHFTIEKRYIRKDGGIVWVRRCVSLIRNADHTPLYLVSQLENITEQKRVTEQLKANENLLQLFVQHSPAALAMFDMNMCYVQVSRRWMADYGLSGMDIIGKSHYEIFPTIPQQWKDIHSRCLNGAIEANEEDSFIREDGTRSWLKWEIHPWRNVAGEIGGIIMLTEVITEKKESQLKFQNLVEMSLVGVYILTDGKFAYVNPRIVEESGYTEEELTQMPIAQFIHPDDLATVYNNVQARLSGDTDSVSYEVRVHKKNGELMWLEMFGSMTLYKGVNSIIGTMVNITQRKKMELERQKMITDLMSRNKDLHEFAQMVSHNLRGPLSTILGLSNMLKEEITEDDKNFVLEGFGVSAEKLDTVVRQMNDILNARGDISIDNH